MIDLIDCPETIKSWLADHVLDVIAYVDTVEMFVRFIPVGTRKAIEAQGCALRTEPCRDRNGWLIGHRLIVHHPTQPVIQIFDRLHDLPHCWACLRRFDIAVDFTTRSQADAEWLKDWLSRHIVMRWRRRGPMREFSNGIYWVNQRHRRQRGKKGSNRDVLVYADRYKITHGPCAHLELRFRTARACRAQGIGRAIDLINLDPSKLLDKHLSLAFISEPFVQRSMRDAVNEDRDRNKDRELSAFNDQYRASISRRVKSLLHRAGYDRATWIRDQYPHLKAAKSYSLPQLFKVPNKLVPMSTYQHHGSFLNYSMISVTATSHSNGNSEPTISSV
jgi:hypothetical protein